MASIMRKVPSAEECRHVNKCTACFRGEEATIMLGPALYDRNLFPEREYNFDARMSGTSPIHIE